MDRQKGFTIVELVVVIAIIAVLASIVVVNISKYINKGKDAAIKSSLSSIIIKGTELFANVGNYSTFCEDGEVAAAINSVNNVGGTATVCKRKTNDYSQWCACKQERVDASLYFCIDSTGIKKDISTECNLACYDGATAARGKCN